MLFHTVPRLYASASLRFQSAAAGTESALRKALSSKNEVPMKGFPASFNMKSLLINS